MGRNQDKLTTPLPLASPKARAGGGLCVGGANVVVKETTWKDAALLFGLWSVSTHIPPSMGALSCPGTLSKKQTQR